MATLTSAQRDDVSAEFQRTLSNDRTAFSLNKTELRAALDQLDGDLENALTLLKAKFTGRTATAITDQILSELLFQVATKRREVR